MSDYYVTPVIITEFFKNTKLKDLSLDELSSNLQEAIIEDPELSDATNISIKAEDESGTKEPVIHIIGKVKNDKDKDRAQEIVEKNTGREIEVSNELKVE